MISYLVKKLIPNPEQVLDPKTRGAYGTLCSFVGIFLNVLLFIGKLLAGTWSGSVAITADAFNNLSDAGSSVVTLLGFKVANQKPDAEHPFGHGRVEYLSGLAVSCLIILMGFELGKSSVEKIIHPGQLTTSWLTIGILLVSILVKIYMWSYNKTIGKKIASTAMEATAEDSLSDCIATGAVLIASLLHVFFDWHLDGIFGLLVAVLIVRAGIMAAKETISPLLGQPPTEEFVRQIRDIVMAHEEVVGVHDLIVHDYGPGRVMISIHAEVPASGNIMELHDVIDQIEQELRRETNCLATIHMDPVDTDDSKVGMLKEELSRRIQSDIDERITIHDFRIVSGPTHTNLIFDAVVPFGCPIKDSEAEEKIKQLVHQMDNSYFAVITIDKSYV